MLAIRLNLSSRLLFRWVLGFVLLNPWLPLKAQLVSDNAYFVFRNGQFDIIRHNKDKVDTTSCFFTQKPEYLTLLRDINRLDFRIDSAMAKRFPRAKIFQPSILWGYPVSERQWLVSGGVRYKGSGARSNSIAGGQWLAFYSLVGTQFGNYEKVILFSDSSSSVVAAGLSREGRPLALVLGLTQDSVSQPFCELKEVNGMMTPIPLPIKGNGQAKFPVNRKYPYPRMVFNKDNRYLFSQVYPWVYDCKTKRVICPRYLAQSFGDSSFVLDYLPHQSAFVIFEKGDVFYCTGKERKRIKTVRASRHQLMVVMERVLLYLDENHKPSSVKLLY